MPAFRSRAEWWLYRGAPRPALPHGLYRVQVPQSAVEMDLASSHRGFKAYTLKVPGEYGLVGALGMGANEGFWIRRSQVKDKVALWQLFNQVSSTAIARGLGTGESWFQRRAPLHTTPHHTTPHHTTPHHTTPHHTTPHHTTPHHTTPHHTTPHHTTPHHTTPHHTTPHHTTPHHTTPHHTTPHHTTPHHTTPHHTTPHHTTPHHTTPHHTTPHHTTPHHTTPHHTTPHHTTPQWAY